MSLAIILGILLAISEGLAQIPVLKANSVFQLICNVLNALVAAIKAPPGA